MVAGRAAHSGSREESALEFYRVAESLAGTPRQTRDALWGQLAAASSLEMDEAHDLVDCSRRHISRSDQYELVRMADRKLGVDVRSGAIRQFGECSSCGRVGSDLEDPFARCSFRSRLRSRVRVDALRTTRPTNRHSSCTRMQPSFVSTRTALCTSGARLRHGRTGSLRRCPSGGGQRDSRGRRCNDEYGAPELLCSRVRISCSRDEPARPAPSRLRILGTLSQRARRSARIPRPRARHSGTPRRGPCAGDMQSQATKAVEVRVLVPAIEAICRSESGQPR